MSTAILQCRLGGALSGAGLQHPELAVLDGELHVLHVAVVALQQVEIVLKLGEGPGISASSEGASEPASILALSVMFCGVRIPATTSSPWALTRNSP